LIDRRIGIIGCGNMGEALLAGLLKKNVFDKKNITVSEKQEERFDFLKNNHTGINFVKDNKILVEDSSVIILAVKPQDMESLLQEISPSLTPSQLIISIVAGIKFSFIEKIIQKNIPVIRAMPNLPALIGEGISAYSLSQAISKENEEITEKILGSIGKVIKMEEEKLDAVTALSGSGPAYVFYMLEAMIEAGIELGITKEEAKILSVQTIIGAGKMVEKGEDPATLRKKVTSPKGTTEAAFEVLRDKKWKEILIEAIKKAEQRSKELSK
jgi:pyrroline-5-carboxylate reductase